MIHRSASVQDSKSFYKNTKSADAGKNELGHVLQGIAQIPQSHWSGCPGELSDAGAYTPFSIAGAGLEMTDTANYWKKEEAFR